MKKHIILYSVFAIALGITLGAFGIYLMRLNLLEMLVDSLKDTGIVGVIIVFLFYIPILFMRIFFWGLYVYGILYVLSGIIVPIAFFKGNLAHLQKILLAFQIINALILFLVIIVDVAVIYFAGESFMSGISLPVIIFIFLITALCVALQIIAVLAYRKLKETIIAERQPQ